MICRRLEATCMQERLGLRAAASARKAAAGRFTAERHDRVFSAAYAMGSIGAARLLSPLAHLPTELRND